MKKWILLMLVVPAFICGCKSMPPVKRWDRGYTETRTITKRNYQMKLQQETGMAKVIAICLLQEERIERQERRNIEKERQGRAGYYGRPTDKTRPIGLWKPDGDPISTKTLPVPNQPVTFRWLDSKNKPISTKFEAPLTITVKSDKAGRAELDLSPYVGLGYRYDSLILTAETTLGGKTISYSKVFLREEILNFGPAPPCKLGLALRFVEKRKGNGSLFGLIPNQKLDGGEKGWIEASVTCEKGPAKNARIIFAVPSNIQMEREKAIGNLIPGDKKTFWIPLQSRSLSSLADGSLLLSAILEETRGQKTKAELKIPTRAYEPLNLQIVSFSVNDKKLGNGDGVLQSDEEAFLEIKIKNAGKGTAFYPRLRLVSPSIQIDKGVISLRNLPPGKTATGHFKILAPRLHQGKTLPFTFKMQEIRGQSFQKAYKAPFELLSPKLLCQSSFQDQEKGAKIHNGSRVALKVTLENRGNLSAKGVQIKLIPKESAQKWISFTSTSTMQVSTLAPGKKNPLSPFVFSISRICPLTRLSFQIETTQKDFPALIQKVEIPVELRRPILRCGYRIRDEKGKKKAAYAPGEKIRLFLKLKNKGNGMAKKIKIKISTDSAPGVILQGEKNFQLKQFAQGKVREIPFEFLIQPKTSQGVKILKIKIEQIDFPSVRIKMQFTVSNT